MFQLKYNGDFLDLGPDQKLEFERENPLFILNDFYKEYTTPVIIKYSEKNVAILGALFFDKFNHQPIKIDIELWQLGALDRIVTLVVDKADTDRRNAGKGDVNGYLLAGLSRLFFKIKFRYLNTLQLGGKRNFEFTTDNPTDGSDGYFQHFFATADNTFDYMIAPVRNDIFNGTPENSSGWMNDWLWQGLSNTPAIPTTDKTNPQYYSENEYKYAVVFPRLKYVLTQIFLENGYVLDTSELDGSTSWENIFLLSLWPIYFYCSLYRQTLSLTQPFAPSITIDLSYCISPEITCATFVLQICKKYGWTILETGSDSYKLIALKNVKSFSKLDVTKYVSDSTQADFSIGERIQSFTNTFPDGEEFASGETPTLQNDKGIYFGKPVYNIAELPDLTLINDGGCQLYDNCYIYVYNENKYYTISLQTSTVSIWNNIRIWTPVVDNIYDLKPPNNTESIDTTVTTLPIYWTQFKTNYTTNVVYYGYFPICKNSRLNNWGIRTMLFVGMVTEIYLEVNVPDISYTGPLTTAIEAGTDPYTSVKTLGAFQYPLMSCCRNNGVADILPWSNSYTHLNPVDGKDYGIVAYWFQKWLDTIGLTNIYEQNIYLPFHLLKKLTFDTILLIDNVPYLIQSYTEPIPYKGFILAKLIRLIMDKRDCSVTISTNIYVKFYWENTFETTYVPIGTGNTVYSKPIIKAYSDPNEVNLIPNLHMVIKVRLYVTDATGANPLGGVVGNTYDPTIFSNYIGTYYAKIFLKDGTFNLANAELISDVLFVNKNYGGSGNYLFFIAPIPVSSDGNYIQSQLINYPAIPAHDRTPAVPARTTYQLQNIELCFSPNYIIIP